MSERGIDPPREPAHLRGDSKSLEKPPDGSDHSDNELDGDRDTGSHRLLTLTSAGLYCPVGDFHIDPWRPVKKALITHAHSDHARFGSERYLAVDTSEKILRHRLGGDIALTTLTYGQREVIHGVDVSFYPAGHVLGSAQIRLEHKGYVAVVTGDFKRDIDSTCVPFEPIPCHLLVTESTFGLPVFRWPDPSVVANEINDWWRANASDGKTSLLYAYGLGKSQRLLSMVDPGIGPIYLHGAVAGPTQIYREHGVHLPETKLVSQADAKTDWSDALVLAVPSAHNTPWIQRFKRRSTAIASGWMQIRGNRRRRNVDRGIVLSDHADWSALLKTVEDCTPETVWVTHGFADVYSRYLVSKGISSVPLRTEFVGESVDTSNSEDV